MGKACDSKLRIGLIYFILLCAGLAMPLSATAVIVQELYSFPALASPTSVLVQDSAGALYGTTSSGGDYGVGTIYRATTNGLIQTLVSFNNTNGNFPNNDLVFGEDGALYGTTLQGGSNSCGTIFRVTTNGFLTTLLSFDFFPKGAFPEFGLVRGTDGYFYGTTSSGGPEFNYGGTVFRLTTNGTLTTLASFSGFSALNGSRPAALAIGKDSTLYGITMGGGINDSGTIFKVATNGALTTLAPFADTNGQKAFSSLAVGSNGTLYGVITGNNPWTTDLFQVTTNGALTILASSTNGFTFNPRLALASNGDIYGTAFPYNFPSAYMGGVMFKFTPSDGFTVLTSFADSNLYNPSAGLAFGKDGALYGATATGGDFNYGAVFRANTNGDLTTLAYFEHTNGLDPMGGLTQADDGLFYGTTSQGGKYNEGTLFRLTANGTLTYLVIFDGTNGYFPLGNLVVGSDKALYGVTSSGGTNWTGTVFKITTNGVFTTLTEFDGTNISYPSAGLIGDEDGFFYGTTSGGGTNDAGTVFRINNNGVLTILASFPGTNQFFPSSALLHGSDGNFYGTTYFGGIYNVGTVFKVRTNGDITTLASFDNTNGANPQATLIEGLDGAFYGTTPSGGSNNWGTVFRINTSGTLNALASFGSYPNLGLSCSGLILDTHGAFYGRALEFFRITTNGILTILAPDYVGNSGGDLIQASDGWYYANAGDFGARLSGGTIFRMNPKVQMSGLVQSTTTWNVSFNGIPGDTYQVLRATNLFGPWDIISSTITDENGDGHYTDDSPPSDHAFYRTLTP